MGLNVQGVASSRRAYSLVFAHSNFQTAAVGETAIMMTPMHPPNIPPTRLPHRPRPRKNPSRHDTRMIAQSNQNDVSVTFSASFLGLPLKLRRHIYGFCIPQNTIIESSFRTGDPSDYCPSPSPATSDHDRRSIPKDPKYASQYLTFAWSPPRLPTDHQRGGANVLRRKFFRNPPLP